MPETPLMTLAEQALAYAKAAGATAADVMVVRSVQANAGIRNGTPETIERAESRGLGLRVFVGESSASISTSELKPTSLRDVAEKAVAIAKVAPADPFASLADASLLARQFVDLDLADAVEPTMADLQKTARAIENAGRTAPGITNSEGADAGYSSSHVTLATSHGFSGSYAVTHHSISVSLIAGAGDKMERDYDYATTTHLVDLPSLESIGEAAAKRTLARLNPRKIPSQTAPVFFEPRAGRQLLGALAGAISGAAIARGTSFLKSDLGAAIFSDAITIIDDPLRKRGLGSHPFDAEGVAVSARNIIDAGTLTSWLLDTRSAKQLGLTSTGHASRGLGGAPHPSTSNFYMKPGTKTPQQLFSELGSGLLVTDTIGHGANLITGDYSIGASGFWVEKGVVQYPVSEITIAGNLRAMFKTLIAANDLSFRYATNVPTIAIPAMTIAGN
ncbi:MAG: modulator protein [Rhodospirillales bacterium 12-54-5]|nr:MAG: modulator protein [Rhodospirillales bacterium 12-54-5]